MRSTRLLALLLLAPLPAQLSGAYTVDPQGSGPRNFTSLNAASSALGRQGISGPVTVTIADGTYTDDWFVSPVPGASATQRVVFRAANRHQVRFESVRAPHSRLTILDFGSQNPVRWIRFEGLRFGRRSGSNAYPFDLYAREHSSDVHVHDCLFEESTIVVLAGQRWEISHCTWAGGLGGYTTRLLDAGAVTIHHCNVHVNSGYGLLLTSRPGAAQSRVYNNAFWGRGRSRGHAHLNLAGAQNVVVEHNTFVLDANSAGAACLRVKGGFARPIEVRHNVFVSLGADCLIEFGERSPYYVLAEDNLHHAPAAAELFRSLSTTGSQGSGIGKDLVSFQQRYGMELGSIQADPRLEDLSTAPWDLRPKADSPAIAKATKTSAFVTDDLDGKPRFQLATLGAYEGAPPVSLQVFGQGCAGSGGKVPKIGSSGDRVYGSKTFRITLSDALGQFGSNAVLALGRSRTNYGGIPLPLALGGGCDLLVSLDLLFFTPLSGGTGPGLGTASINLFLPLDPKLQGLQLHFQWAVADPQAKGIGLAFSDAATLGF